MFCFRPGRLTSPGRLCNLCCKGACMGSRRRTTSDKCCHMIIESVLGGLCKSEATCLRPLDGQIAPMAYNRGAVALLQAGFVCFLVHESGKCPCFQAILRSRSDHACFDTMLQSFLSSSVFCSACEKCQGQGWNKGGSSSFAGKGAPAFGGVPPAAQAFAQQFTPQPQVPAGGALAWA